ncbi:MAG: C45 family autoproteolytic acyltransferase/hydrolase [Christensenellales bacterium]
MYHPRLKGNHYEIGKRYGDLLYKAGEDLSSVIKLNSKQVEFGKLCLPIYEKYMKDIMEEVRGLADGLRQKYDDVAYWLFNIYCNKEECGCSVFAVKGNDGVYFARNMDMFPEYKKTSESVLYRVENKNTFLAHSTAMISLEDGINEYGLCIALTFLLSKKIKPGINGGFIVRKVLEECKTTKEAIELIKSLPRSSSHNMVIADKSGDMAVVECTSEDVNVRYNEKYLIATNHFISDNMVKYNNEEYNWYYTNDRYNTIDNSLRNNRDINFEECKNIISGKYGFVCQFAKNLHFDTIWSAVYRLDDLYNEICEGNPSKSKYTYDNRLEWGIKQNNKNVK